MKKGVCTLPFGYKTRKLKTHGLVKYLKNHRIFIDAEDSDKFDTFVWHVVKDGNTFYVVGYLRGNTKEKQTLQCLILNKPRGTLIDHINHNGLDNRKCNLRFCTTQSNGANRLKQKNGRKGKCSCQFKGVSSWKAIKTKKYVGTIIYKRKRIHLGYYLSETEAAIAYNVAAKFLFREFAYLNEVSEPIENFKNEIIARIKQYV